MPDAARVLIVSPNWLGDAVMALPAMHDVRRHFSGARLIVAGRSAVATLFTLVPWIDEIVTLTWRGELVTRSALTTDVARLRQSDPDVAILLTNSFATAWLTKQAGVRERWGYATDLRRLLLTRAIRRPSHSVHQGGYYQHLTLALGMEAGPLEPALDVAPAALDRARALLTAAGWDGERRLVVMAPGAAYGTAKRWLPRHFTRLIARLVREAGVYCVLVGSAADAQTTTIVVEALDSDTRAHVADLAGRTSLEMLTALLALADACVSNDSGAMHLAAAAGAPLAALFGPTRDRETAPLARAGRRADVLINPVWCRPCMLRECPIDHRCMRGLTPDRVFAAVNSLMHAPTER
jgi:heptosyltransferase-2